MANIKFYAPSGVSDATLSDGRKITVASGYATADSKYAPELMLSGWTPAMEDGVTATVNSDGSVSLYVNGIAIQTGGTQTVTSITNNTDGTVNTYVKSGITYTVSYNAAGYVSVITGSNGSTVTPTYDVNNAVTAVTVA
jgi:YD repeat-containing protein